MEKFIPLSVPTIKGNEWLYVKECLDTEWVSSVGSYVKRFEELIANYVGLKYAVACINGTAALQLALRVCGVGCNDEVLVPTLTFIASANAVKYLGAEPVFMDSDQYYNLDVKKVKRFLEEECESREGKCYNKKTGRQVKAVVPVHLFGVSVDMDPLLEICQKYNLRIIEDACEALGSEYKGKRVGNSGDIACFSFNGNKIMTTGGGGMLVTNNKELADKALYLTNQAKKGSDDYVHEEIGYNYRLSNVAAAIGVAQFEQLTGFIQKKRENLETYKRLLADSPVKVAVQPEYSKSNCWFYSLQFPNKELRNQVKETLARNNIQARLAWSLAHEQKPYLGCQSYRIEKAKELWDRTLNVPCSVSLTEEDIEEVCDVVKQSLSSSKQEKEILAIIPARGGSKRIPKKNIKDLVGSPLISYAIKQSKNSKFITRTVVSTDDEDIKLVSLRENAEVIDRPKELAQDDTPTVPVLNHVLRTLENEGYSPDIVVVLQPTSPLRDVEDIDKVILKVIHGADSAETFSPVTTHPAYMAKLNNNKVEFINPQDFLKRSQDLPEYYIENGAVYAVKTKLLTENQTLYGNNHEAVIMPLERSIDIDEPHDFKIAEALLSKESKEKEFSFSGRTLSKNSPCFIVAEIGVNHNQDLELAKKMVLSAKQSGADAVKFQTWKTENIILNNVEMAEYQKENLQSQESQFDMLKKLELPYPWHFELKKYAEDLGLIFFSTMEDKESVDFLIKEVKIPLMKVGSGDITNYPLLKYTAKFNLPMVISSGTTTIEEVKKAVDILRNQGNDQIIVCQCTSNYPCADEEVNVRAMLNLKENLNTLVGFSDHSLGSEAPVAARALGAVYIEKHFTIDKNLPGPDHKASLTPDEFKAMVDAVRRTEKLLGDGKKKPMPSEIPTRELIIRRIVAARDLKEGDLVTEENFIFKRANQGLEAKNFFKFKGKKLTRDLKKDEVTLNATYFQ